MLGGIYMYFAKLDNTNHIQTIYLQGQLTSTDGYVQVDVPDYWKEDFWNDWTNFYIESDGSLNFDNQKATQTQQQINNLTNVVNRLVVQSVKGVTK